jgi:antibiotic biosynthesis monooxygenase (ABM) superfamily enzyme
VIESEKQSVCGVGEKMTWQVTKSIVLWCKVEGMPRGEKHWKMQQLIISKIMITIIDT